MGYHVFKKTRIVGGKKIHKWYYYYRQNGKQIQKVCKNCSNLSGTGKTMTESNTVSFGKMMMILILSWKRSRISVNIAAL